ncbi:hypothetical protein SPRG_07309 [Saprolegnia parasitica CBS 223.65]|uniref:Uncharacterized protein n=1 Tax=Saprolegnia parasitica (strain CBS 223.65) TaxID=695850 RepID=A0A067CEW4_SAPPC|nr:hypothetical protein SPRG_07309 [Saprolegnia parasitica CBS 223.65]KDO27680.1 hypothetical protein SPRG_07309 [Saprolegnia parasitica CBS 223.65]|eukprot:XP_012201491.1 hypothetical protein SPRG_07309 [Saprolegnia parasitica CBS 223.65]
MWKPGTAKPTEAKPVAAKTPVAEAKKASAEAKKSAAPKAPKPTLSQNTLAMKFMQRKNTAAVVQEVKKPDDDDWDMDGDAAATDGKLVVIKDPSDPAIEKQLGRRSFGGFNAAVEEELKAATSQRRHSEANKRALKEEVSAEEMADRMIKYTGLRNNGAGNQRDRPKKRQKKA